MSADCDPVGTMAGGLQACLDCGEPTFCNVAHGAGHDHSPEAEACTKAALAS